MPRVSVVIPLYNKECYIRRCLDSVFAQTFRDFEVIVVDDGSTDGGPEIVKSYTDPRVRLIRQENAGPGATRNRGVREGTAPYLAFLDADDEWMPDFLRVSIEALEEHPECSVSVTSRYEGRPRWDISPKLRAWGHRNGVWSLPEDMTVKAFPKACPSLWTGAVVCRRSTIESLGGFYERHHAVSGEDDYLWLQLVFTCSLFVILRPLAWYHREAGELGYLSNSATEVAPFYYDPGRLLRNCPSQHKTLLEAYLTSCAFNRASDLCKLGNVEAAKRICRTFPVMKRFTGRYAKLRIKMMFPLVYRIFRRLKEIPIAAVSRDNAAYP